MLLRVLTVAELRQSRGRYQSLRRAVGRHKPDALALVGDFLDLERRSSDRLGTAQCAAFLANMPVKHVLFTRGNHEGANWREFVRAWPLDWRPLTALYGTAFTLGPLVVLGFPCWMGREKPWANSMPKQGNQLTRDPAKSGRPELPLVV